MHERCPPDATTLAKDPDLQDIVAVNLVRAVQLCVDVAATLLSDSRVPPPDTMGASFDALVELGAIDSELAARLKAAVGFRDVAVHSYRSIDWNVVHGICTDRPGDFQRFAAAVERFAS